MQVNLQTQDGQTFGTRRPMINGRVVSRKEWVLYRKNMSKVVHNVVEEKGFFVSYNKDGDVIKRVPANARVNVSNGANGEGQGVSAKNYYSNPLKTLYNKLFGKSKAE